MGHIDRHALIQRAVDYLTDVPSYVWDGRTLPVPIDEIADTHAGLLVREVQDMESAPGIPETVGGRISGLYLPDLGEIWVNAFEARRWPRRRRYTIAHELGHHVLHCRHGKPAPIYCRAKEVRVAPAGLVLTEEQSRPLEEEANIFGGALLMPPDLMREVADECGGDLRRVADRFDCSLSAVSPRWLAHYQHR